MADRATVEEVPLDRIEAVGQMLYLSGEETSDEDRAEYEDFVETVSKAVNESEEVRKMMAVYLGIIDRVEADKLAAEAYANPVEVVPKPDPARDELIEELRQLNSEATNFDVHPTVATKIFGDDGTILEEAADWGTSDTVIREESYSVLSQALIGREWPMNGDKLTDEEFDTFLADLKTAHDELLAELQVEQKD